MTERICSARGCGTSLSIRNIHDFCSLHDREPVQFIAVCFRKGKDNKGRAITYRHVMPLQTLSSQNAVSQALKLGSKKSWKLVILVHRDVAKKEIMVIKEFGDTTLKQEWGERNKEGNPAFSGQYYSEKNLLEEIFPLFHTLAAHH